MFTPDNFPNFFRIVPSENAFNAPRLRLLEAFNWTRVGTIYQNEPRYSLVSTLRFFASLPSNNYCESLYLTSDYEQSCRRKVQHFPSNFVFKHSKNTLTS